MSETGTVLVTGGSGYIGSWCVIGLLQQGYTVRTTVRDLSTEPAARAAISSVVDPGNRLSFHAANLSSDAGWDEATAGAEYVLHVASPLGVPEPKDPKRPDRSGSGRRVARHQCGDQGRRHTGGDDLLRGGREPRLGRTRRRQ